MNARLAKQLLIGGAVAASIAMAANFLLGGTGGLLWLGLVVAGVVCIIIALVYYVTHPVRRGT